MRLLDLFRPSPLVSIRVGDMEVRISAVNLPLGERQAREFVSNLAEFVISQLQSRLPHAPDEHVKSK